MPFRAQRCGLIPSPGALENVGLLPAEAHRVGGDVVLVAIRDALGQVSFGLGELPLVGVDRDQVAVGPCRLGVMAPGERDVQRVAHQSGPFQVFGREAHRLRVEPVAAHVRGAEPGGQLLSPQRQIDRRMVVGVQHPLVGERGVGGGRVPQNSGPVASSLGMERHAGVILAPEGPQRFQHPPVNRLAPVCGHSLATASLAISWRNRTHAPSQTSRPLTSNWSMADGWQPVTDSSNRTSIREPISAATSSTSRESALSRAVRASTASRADGGTCSIPA
jgi:hypothetical protein